MIIYIILFFFISKKTFSFSINNIENDKSFIMIEKIIGNINNNTINHSCLFGKIIFSISETIISIAIIIFIFSIIKIIIHAAQN